MTNFNELLDLQASLCVNLLGGVAAIYNHDSDIDTIVVIDRDMDVPVDGGLAFVRKTVITLKKADIGRGEIGATITVDAEVFTIEGFVTEDDQIIQVYVR